MGKYFPEIEVLPRDCEGSEVPRAEAGGDDYDGLCD